MGVGNPIWRRAIDAAWSAEQIPPAERQKHNKESDMVIWVKTTIDIATGLLMEAKERAHRDQTTLRELVERGLRTVLSEPEASTRPPFKPVTCRLEPLPGVDPYDWDAILDSVYDMSDRV
jgi:hypothetical protein